jgi:hypothetical protein
VVVVKYSDQKKAFAKRFLALKGEDSFVTLAKKMKRRGIDISPAALYKWTDGGGINSDTLMQVADYFGVSAAELFFGELPPTPHGGLSEDAYLIGWCWSVIPERMKKIMRGDILRMAKAYAPNEPNMVRRLDGAISKLK